MREVYAPRGDMPFGFLVWYDAATSSLLFIMKSRIGLVIGWICAVLISLLNVFAALSKFFPQISGAQGAAMMQQLGVSSGMEHVLGVIEVLIIILFLIPRTSTVGFVLMVGYMGGAFATNLTHGYDRVADVVQFLIIFAILTVSAWFRNPELLARLCKRPVS